MVSPALESPRAAHARSNETERVTSSTPLEEMRGSSKNDRAEFMLARWEKMTDARPGQKEMLETLAAEGCSERFAKELLASPELRKRVLKVCELFAARGEQMARLEEAEIYCALMEKGGEDVGSMRAAVGFEGKFPGMRDLTPAELRMTRLKKVSEMMHLAVQDDKSNLAYAEVLGKSLAQALGKEAEDDQVTDFAWQQSALNEIVRDAAAVERLLKDPTMQQAYKRVHGQSIESSHRRVALSWKELPDGSRVPSMYVEGMAMPSKIEGRKEVKCSVLSFVVEGRAPEGSQEPQQRILKDIVVKIDSAKRGQNQGIEFLLDKLPLTKKYKIQEVQFNANIRIGSYAWRFADMDVREMANHSFENEDWQAVGGKGEWTEERLSKAERHIMVNFVMPVYERQLYVAMGSLQKEWRDKNPATVKRWQAEFEDLKVRAGLGALTMEDLADFGKDDEKPFLFDEDGNQTDDPGKAKNRGHVGKAAIMGLPWYAKVGTDRTSLSRVIDKLYKGSSMKGFLMKAGLAFFH